jgi:hypothetical protein
VLSLFLNLFLVPPSPSVQRGLQTADRTQFVETFFSQHIVVAIITAFTLPTRESVF